MSTTTSTGIDPRVAQAITEQIDLSVLEIADLRKQIAEARPVQLGGMVTNLARELAYLDQLRRIETMLSNASASDDPKLVLLAQLRDLAEETRRVADNGRNESRDQVDSRGLALREAYNAVYYALYDDLRGQA